MIRRIIELDVRLTSWSRLVENSRLIKPVAALFAHSGDSWFWLLGLGILWLLGTDFWKSIAVNLAIGVAITALLVLAIKFSVRRSRPAGEWGRIYRNTDPHSFPSGHAARAVMLAVLGVGLGPTWFGALLAGWAPLVGLARLAMGVHYLSDIVAGMALGLAMGVILLRFF
jgi:membrane-associated phospholipid phosphatase